MPSFLGASFTSQGGQELYLYLLASGWQLLKFEIWNTELQSFNPTRWTP